jgi:hypothetical protein
MGGLGKWIKKHPLQTIGLLGAAVTGGTSLGLFGAAEAAAPALAPAVFGGAEGALGAAEMAMLGESAAGPLAANGLMPGLAPMATIDNAAPAYAALDAGKFNPSTPGLLDNFSKGDLFAMKEGMGLLNQGNQQQPMPVAPPQGYRGPGQQLPMPSMYDDSDLKKRMAQMAQSGRFYG